MPSQDSGMQRSFEFAESRHAAEMSLNGQAMVSPPCPELSVGRERSRNDGRVEDVRQNRVDSSIAKCHNNVRLKRADFLATPQGVLDALGMGT
jgi:hypothetical protein